MPIIPKLIELIISCTWMLISEEPAATSFMPCAVICAVIISSGDVLPPKKKRLPDTKTVVRIPHRNTCVRPTKPMPMIFPIIRSNGLTDEIITSIIRFVFSSITPCMTIPPYMMINIQIMKVNIMPKIEATSAEVLFSLPSSSHLMVLILKLILLSSMICFRLSML